MSTSTVRFFHSAQAGAPELKSVAGSLIALLDACLVEGFGLVSVDSLIVTDGVATATMSTGHSAETHTVVSIAGATPAGLNGAHRVIGRTTNTVRFSAPGVADGTATGTITLKIAPAGWEKAWVGAHKAAFRSAAPDATRFFLRIDDSNLYEARVVGYEAMSDVDVGEGAFPTAAQVPGGTYWAKASNTSARPWILIASDRYFYLGVCHNHNWTPGYAFRGFGDILPRFSADAFRCHLAGSPTTYYNTPPGASYGMFDFSNYVDHRHVMARAWTGIGGAVVARVQSPIGANASFATGQGTLVYPNPTDNGLLLQTIGVNQAEAYRGNLPGVWSSPQNIGTHFANGPAWGVLDPSPSLPDRVVIWAQSTGWSSGGPVFFDLTGPWAAP